MVANKLILRAMMAVLGPLLSVAIAVAQQAPREADCNELQKVIPEPSKATATVRGEFLKNGKTLVQDIFLSSAQAPRTKAFLIKPYKVTPGGGGAVLFLHWLGAPPANDLKIAGAVIEIWIFGRTHCLQTNAATLVAQR